MLTWFIVGSTRHMRRTRTECPHCPPEALPPEALGQSVYSEGACGLDKGIILGYLGRMVRTGVREFGHFRSTFHLSRPAILRIWHAGHVGGTIIRRIAPISVAPPLARNGLRGSPGCQSVPCRRQRPQRPAFLSNPAPMGWRQEGERLLAVVVIGLVPCSSVDIVPRGLPHSCQASTPRRRDGKWRLIEGSNVFASDRLTSGCRQRHRGTPLRRCFLQYGFHALVLECFPECSDRRMRRQAQLSPEKLSFDGDLVGRGAAHCK